MVKTQSRPFVISNILYYIFGIEKNTVYKDIPYKTVDYYSKIPAIVTARTKTAAKKLSKLSTGDFR